MRVHYIGCFRKNDGAEAPLVSMLADWEKQAGRALSKEIATNGEDLKARLLAVLDNEAPDVLIVGGHGHDSLAGFIVQTDPVRWHDLALLLRGHLAQACTFIFYSCNGGYPGIALVFGRTGGPDFVFGPRIHVLADAMTHATRTILDWKEAGGGNVASARGLVDGLHAWATAKYPTEEYDHSFLRVMWDELGGRYPDGAGPDRPDGTKIALRGWGL